MLIASRWTACQVDDYNALDTDAGRGCAWRDHRALRPCGFLKKVLTTGRSSSDVSLRTNLVPRLIDIATRTPVDCCRSQWIEVHGYLWSVKTFHLYETLARWQGACDKR